MYIKKTIACEMHKRKLQGFPPWKCQMTLTNFWSSVLLFCVQLRKLQIWPVEKRYGRQMKVQERPKGAKGTDVYTKKCVHKCLPLHSNRKLRPNSIQQFGKRKIPLKINTAPRKF